MFAAEFRFPRSLSAAKKCARVHALIDQLSLLPAARTIIGDEGQRGVSSGEHRRVSIRTDIIHDPIILFLDEPTSGLDPTNAFMVVQVLQKIAQSGSIVITSIHQPSYRIMGLLDRLIFLSRGRTVYSGPPDGLPVFLAEFGHPIPENENRTEFVLDLIREMGVLTRWTPGFHLSDDLSAPRQLAQGRPGAARLLRVRDVHHVLHLRGCLPVFLQERYIFMRETAYNAYRRSSYVLSNAVVGFPR